MTPKKSLNEYLSELRLLCEKATPGPWHVHNPDLGDREGLWIKNNTRDFSIANVRRGCEEAGPHSMNEIDANLIALSRAAIPRLIAALELAIEQRDDWMGEANFEDDSVKKDIIENQDAELERILNGQSTKEGKSDE